MGVAYRFDTQQLDASRYGSSGYFDDSSQFQYILARQDRFVDTARHVLVIGYAGVDGVEFVLKPQDSSIYAYYPIEARMERLAADFQGFIQGWIDGKITV